MRTMDPRPEQVIARFGGMDEAANRREILAERVTIRAETQPLAQVSAVARVPVGAAVDGTGRYMLVDRAAGSQPLEWTARSAVVEP